MIRLLLGLAAPVLALGLAAGFVGPSLVAGSGAPMLVAAEPDPALQAANFDGERCLSDLVFGESKPGAGFVLLLAQGRGPRGVNPAYVVIFSSEGRIVAIERAPEPQPRDSAGASAGCQPGSDGVVDGSI